MAPRRPENAAASQIPRGARNQANKAANPAASLSHPRSQTRAPLAGAQSVSRKPPARNPVDFANFSKIIKSQAKGRRTIISSEKLATFQHRSRSRSRTRFVTPGTTDFDSDDSSDTDDEGTLLPSSSTLSAPASPTPPPQGIKVSFGALDVRAPLRSTTPAEYQIKEYNSCLVFKPERPLQLTNHNVLLMENREWNVRQRGEFGMGPKRQMEWPSREVAQKTRTLWIELDLPGLSHYGGGKEGFLEYFLEWESARKDALLFEEQEMWRLEDEKQQKLAEAQAKAKETAALTVVKNKQLPKTPATVPRAQPPKLSQWEQMKQTFGPSSSKPPSQSSQNPPRTPIRLYKKRNTSQAFGLDGACNLTPPSSTPKKRERSLQGPGTPSSLDKETSDLEFSSQSETNRPRKLAKTLRRPALSPDDEEVMFDQRVCDPGDATTAGNLKGTTNSPSRPNVGANALKTPDDSPPSRRPSPISTGRPLESPPRVSPPHPSISPITEQMSPSTHSPSTLSSNTSRDPSMSPVTFGPSHPPIVPHHLAHPIKTHRDGTTSHIYHYNPDTSVYAIPEPILSAQFLSQLGQLRKQGFTKLDVLVIELQGFGSHLHGAIVRLLNETWIEWVRESIRYYVGASMIQQIRIAGVPVDLDPAEDM